MSKFFTAELKKETLASLDLREAQLKNEYPEWVQLIAKIGLKVTMQKMLGE